MSDPVAITPARAYSFTPSGLSDESHGRLREDLRDRRIQPHEVQRAYDWFQDLNARYGRGVATRAQVNDASHYVTTLQALQLDAHLRGALHKSRDPWAILPTADFPLAPFDPATADIYAAGMANDTPAWPNDTVRRVLANLTPQEVETLTDRLNNSIIPNKFSRRELAMYLSRSTAHIPLTPTARHNLRSALEGHDLSVFDDWARRNALGAR